MRLDGQVALVTGAAHGLGRHIALALAESGADIALADRDEGALPEVARAAEGLDRRAVCVPADLSDAGAGAEIVSATVAGLGRLDVLVNNAGTSVLRHALDVTEADWDLIADLNLKGAFFMAQAAGRRMIEQGEGGRIVNMASQMAEVGYYGRAAYSASKAGLVGLTRVLALEWAPHGIRVNAVGPTFTDTALARKLMEDPEVAADVMGRIPVGRLGKPEEVAAAVVYLASAGADLVTGHHLVVDGGWTAQ
jgi:2-deoxy-D-gluconate 3-dehydrogenase